MSIINTLFIGHTVSKLEKVDSTNQFLRQLIAEGDVAEGFVIDALEQYAGRGQRGASWYSEPGANLTLSIALRPVFLIASDQFWISKAVALGVAGFVSTVLLTEYKGSCKVEIKWPNDILVNGRKIAGILIENILENSRIRYSIAGIGLNINQKRFDPALPNPLSLALLTGNEYDLNSCMEGLCISIEKYYLMVRNSTFKEVDALYHQILYRKDIQSQFSLGGRQFSGTIKQVTQEGHLLLDAPELKSGQDNEKFFRVMDLKQLQFL